MAGRHRKPALRGPAERDALFHQYQGLVPWVIYHGTQYRGPLRREALRLGWREANQIGLIALLRAAELWNPLLGAFMPYAVASIRGRIIHAVAQLTRKTLRTVSLSDLAEKDYPVVNDPPLASELSLERALRTLTAQRQRAVRLVYGIGGEPMTLLEAGKIMGVTVERVRQIIMHAVHDLGRPFCADPVAAALGLERCRSCQRWVFDHKICNRCERPGCAHCIKRVYNDIVPCCPKCLKEILDERKVTAERAKAEKELHDFRLRRAQPKPPPPPNPPITLNEYLTRFQYHYPHREDTKGDST